jgi:hypothetical protein
MKTAIVSDGRHRLEQGPSVLAQLRAIRASIEVKYAPELAQAGFPRRCVLRWRMAREFRRERQRLLPSAGSLFGTGRGSSNDLC